MFPDDKFINEGDATKLALIARNPNDLRSAKRLARGMGAKAAILAKEIIGFYSGKPREISETSKRIIEWGRNQRKKSPKRYVDSN